MGMANSQESNEAANNDDNLLEAWGNNVLRHEIGPDMSFGWKRNIAFTILLVSMTLAI